MDGFKRPTKPQRPMAGSSKAAPVSRTPEPTQEPVNQLRPSLLGSLWQLPQTAQRPPKAAPTPALPVIDEPKAMPLTSVKKRSKWPFVVIAIVLLLVAVVVGAFLWYQAQLQPLDETDTSVQRVEIKDGSSLNFVAERLEERGLIRSSIAFRIFVNFEGKQAALKAGTCNFTPADSARVILDKLTAGCHDFKSVTFYPGATLETSLYAKNKAAEESKALNDMSIRASLRVAGYSDEDITRAFAASYTSPLFAGKPSSEGYEGYIFGETYYVDLNASAEDVLQMAFDHMYSIVTAEGLEVKFKEQGLNLYQGITLASIVGRELDCEGKPTEERKQRCYGYQQQIAGVFYNRLKIGMSLGSDVTSIYASDKLGVASAIDVDSPYNTRRYAGLTPGPIATPGKLALLSVANPASGEDLFFLAGDDGLIYFARDAVGHEANIVNHCKIGCGNL